MDNTYQHNLKPYNYNYLKSNITNILDNSTPIWIMRQAGRYLPEFKELRKKFPNFFDLCYNPEAAAEVTLQPIRRFGFDAAIIFSDILVLPQALGQKITFLPYVGPQVEKFNSSFLEEIDYKKLATKLDPIYQAISITRKELAPNKSLIGFAGAPFSLLCYMLVGKDKNEYLDIRQAIFANYGELKFYISQLTDLVSLHLIEQIKAGCDVVKLFDSWAKVCPGEFFDDFITTPTQTIVSKIKEEFPHIPIIGFPKGAGVHYLDYLESGVNILAIDWQMPRHFVRDYLQPKVIIQGNMDPAVLLAGKEAIKQEVDDIFAKFGEYPFIFNLGHGINQHTKPEHVEYLVSLVREKGSKNGKDSGSTI